MPSILDRTAALAAGLAALAAGLAALPCPTRAEEALPPPSFVERNCDMPGVAPDMAPRLRCGTVAVPRDEAHPGPARYDLAVVVIRTLEPHPSPDPVLYVSGGPGSPLAAFADYQGRHPYAPGRDLILVDQRGTGRSQPRICPDLDGNILDASLATLSNPSENARAQSRALRLACRDEAVGKGIDLADFGTPVTVEDLDRVREALGVSRWNVVGTSYGTTVAMTLMALHPERVRSAVLDSLYPPDPFLAPWSARVADATDAFLSSCDRDPTCASVHPGLPGAYRDALAGLAARPLVAALPSSPGHPGRDVPLTPALFRTVVGLMIYYPPYYAGLPRLIEAVRDGDARPFASGLADLLAATRTESNQGLHMAVECRDRPHDRATGAADPGTVDALLPGVCADWSSLGPPPLVPVDTPVPTLVLAGAFDPNIEPDVSRHVAELMGPHARWMLFAGLGHSVRHFSPCAGAVVARFIDDPAAPLDGSCADHPLVPRFAPR